MKKSRTVRSISVEPGSGNVYADLGYPDADDMLLKARLVAKIADIIRRRGLTQAKAAKMLGLTQPKISRLLKGQFRGISQRRLLRCLTQLGRDVEIRVKPAPARRSGRLTVHVA
jgi:predicted XRE-type DNA-binding protein